MRARVLFGRSDGSTDVTVRDRLMARIFSRASTVAIFEAPAAPSRRRRRRWRLRDWSLRTKLTAVLVVPLMLAGVLGTLRVTDLVRSAQNFAALARQVEFVQRLDQVVHDLQGERYWVAAMLATGPATDRAALQATVRIQCQRVDTAVARLRAAGITAESLGLSVSLNRPIEGEVDRAAALSRLSSLVALRQGALGSTEIPGNVAASSAVTAYSTLITALLDLDRSVLDGVPAPIAHQAGGATALLTAGEQASLQHTVLQTGILSGSLLPAQQADLRTAEARFDAAAEEFGQAISPAQRRMYFDTESVVSRNRLLAAALERSVRRAPLETVAGDWNSAAVGTVLTMRQGVDTLLEELRTDAQVHSDQVWREAFYDGAAVTALLLLAVVLLVVVVRSLLQPLRTLRTAAFEVADRRLPAAVKSVLATDGGPPPTTVDPVAVHSMEEVGQVARAFDTVHIQAVRLAAEQAQLRSNLNDVFITLSGRSQRLLEQQLRLIEHLRSAVNDPELVSSLCQLDRLAARMRRHSENLLLLAGGPPRRGAEGPVAVLDVLSNAVAESDEHQRVALCPPPTATVPGPVAGDLVHLIAELLDNAINAAPRGTMVTVSCTLIDDTRLLVEITDSGPGLPPDELEAINARLVSAPVPDSSVPGQLGLIVARQLAARHGVTVQLRQRLGERGITATALLPAPLVTVTLPDAPSSTTKWSGAQEQLPLQVSVVDEATAAELFSPSSLGMSTVQPSRPRTAQEEWYELFGHPEPAPESRPVPLEGDQVIVAAAGQPAAVGDDIVGEVREDIFDMVSAWFRERQSALVGDAPVTSAPPIDVMSPDIVSQWRSPLDEGWRAAQALRTRVDHEFTRVGLPKRQPLTHLVSGSDGGVVPTPVPAGPARSAEAVRGRLTRYQSGLRVGRHARISPEEQLAWTNIPQQPLDRPLFEENEQ